MGVVNSNAFVLQVGKESEFGSVVRCYRLEYLVEQAAEFFSDPFHFLHDSLRCLAWDLADQGVPCHPFDYCEQALVVLSFRADDRVDFPMSKFLALINVCRADINAVTKDALVGLNPSSLLTATHFEG